MWTNRQSNLAFHLKGQCGIRKEDSTIDLTQTTRSSQAVLQQYNVMGQETLKAATAALVRFIFCAKLSFNIMDNRAFRLFVRILNRHVPTDSRSTFVRAIKHDFVQQRATIRYAASSVSITCDGWSSTVLCGYFVITCY